MKYTRYDLDTSAIKKGIYQIKVKITHAGGKSLTLYSKQITDAYDINNVAGKIMTTLPDGLSQDLDFMTLESTISSMNFESTNGILTNGQTLSKYIYEKFYDLTNNLRNSKVEIYLQYDLTTNYLLYTGYLTKVDAVDIYETSYRFDIEDITRQIKKETLTEYFDTTTALNFLPVAAYGTFTKFARREEAGNVAASGINNFIETTNQADLEDGGSWYNLDWWYVIRYVGHPIDFAKDLIEIATDIDSYDIASFNLVRNNTKNAAITSFDYELKEGIDDTLEYIREQCFMPTFAFFYIENDGKLYLKQIEQPVVLDPLLEINESNIVDITGGSTGTDNIVNFANIVYDYNEETDEFTSSLFNFDDSEIRQSVETFGTLPDNYSIELKGMNRNAVIAIPSTKEAFADNLTTYIFNRNSMSIKTIELILMFEFAKGLKIGDFVEFTHTKIVNWKKNSALKGERGVYKISDYIYAIIGLTYWGDYTNVYATNNCFDDAQANAGLDQYNGNLTWDYNWYIQSVPNKAVPVTVKNTLTLPIASLHLRNPALISIETFEDILLNYKINDNFLYFHNAD